MSKNKKKPLNFSSRIRSQGYSQLMRRVPNDLPQFIVKYSPKPVRGPEDDSGVTKKVESFKSFYSLKELIAWEKSGVWLDGTYVVYPCAYYKPMRLK